MDQSNPPASDTAFPVAFVVMSTFIGALVWLCVILNSMPAN